MTVDTAPDALPRVAHLLRPAQGGMRELVRTLLRAAEPLNPPFLLAPEDLLESLADAVPGDSHRHLLKAESSAPHHQLAAGQAAGRWAKRAGAEVLHGHGLRYAPLFASASVASGLPLVVSLHNLVPDDMNGLQKTAARAALSRADAVIAVSEAVARSAAEIVGAERLVTIPNGINLSRFAADAGERAARRHAVRESLGIAEDAPVIVCLSRLSAEKDVTNLVEAFALTQARFPDAKLLIAGDGRLRKTLEWHAELLGVKESVLLLGAYGRERIPDLLYAADLFALSSREEGLSLAVLEAMAAGLPVVATDVGGLPEAIARGETGLLAPPRDPAAFASALDALLAEPDRRRTMGGAGNRRVQERFTDTAMIAQTFGVYRRAAHGR